MDLEVTGHSEAPPAQPHEASHMSTAALPMGLFLDQFPHSLAVQSVLTLKVKKELQ